MEKNDIMEGGLSNAQRAEIRSRRGGFFCRRRGKGRSSTRMRKLANNPFALMGVNLILWGSFAAASKAVLKHIDSYQHQFYMFGIAFVVLTAVLLASPEQRKLFRGLKRGDYARLALYGLPSYMYYFLYTLSLTKIPAIEASMLNYLFPLFIVLLAIPMFGEKPDARKLVAVALGLAGMAVIVTGGDLRNMTASNWAGDLLAVGGALSWALFSNLARKNQVPLTVSNYMFTAVAFLLSIVSMACFSRFVVPDVEVGAGLVWISVSNIVLSFYLWTRALKLISPAMIASVTFVTPFVSLLFIWALLGETINGSQATGFLIVVAGIALQSLPGPRSAKSA